MIMMTFRELKKRANVDQNLQQYKFFDKLRNKPFWIWYVQDHKLEDFRTKDIAVLII